MKCEEKYIRDLKRGSKKAFEYLFTTYYQKLLKVANQYLDDTDEAEEIVQEVFYRVWLYRENLKSTLSFKAYVITIAKRLIFNKAKKKVHQATYEKYFRLHNEPLNNSLEEYLNFSELDQRINQKIEGLPPKRREIFIMSRQQGLSHQEIAAKLNISTNTVESQITKAVKFLKQTISPLVWIFFLLFF